MSEMNTKAESRELTSSKLEQVTGGMSCSNALTAAAVYGSLARFYIDLGMSSEGAMYAGMGRGVLQGGCD